MILHLFSIRLKKYKKVKKVLDFLEKLLYDLIVVSNIEKQTVEI